MLPRLSPRAAPPPTPRPSTITPPAYVMTQSGQSGAEGNQETVRGQPARSAARHPSPSPTVSRQLPASSLQAVSRQPSTVSRQPSAISPSPERRERPAKPSAQFSRPLTRPARGERPQTPQPFAPCGGRSSARASPKTSQQPPQKLSTFLLITC